MSISDGVLANAANFNAAFLSQSTAGLDTKLTIVSKTTTYTATATDAVILVDGSAGSWTLSLPTAVGISGKQYIIKRTDLTLDYLVTIDPNSTETIDGSATKTLATQHESYRIISDGTNWKTVDHYISGVSFPVTFTHNWGVNATISGTCIRRGRTGIFQVGILLAGAPSAGNLTITMPTGITLSTGNFETSSGIKPLGYGSANESGALSYNIFPHYLSSTTFGARCLVASATYLSHANVSDVAPITFGNLDAIRMTFESYITEWSS